MLPGVRELPGLQGLQELQGLEPTLPHPYPPGQRGERPGKDAAAVQMPFAGKMETGPQGGRGWSEEG